MAEAVKITPQVSQTGFLCALDACLVNLELG